MTAIVAILAGGAGRRIGGHKAVALLAGRPLISYPLGAARAAGLEVVIIAKPSTVLPELETPVLTESEQLPQHPLSGIVTGLEHFPALVAVPCDMPFLPASLLRTLADANSALLTAAPGQPFPGHYRASTLAQLNQALAAQAPLRSVLVAGQAEAIAGVDAAHLFSVNSATDLAEAERRLALQAC
jgi:molybdopterin-guanine dinucleotide biosynthesis protein A